MANTTNSSIGDSDYPLFFLTCERINAFVISLENILVAVCLFTHRTKFPKKEFWLQLLCLNIHDLFTGTLILLLSFLRSTLSDELCSILRLVITINELTFLCNILGICIYRLLFLIKSGRFRYGWTAKTTLIQITLSLVICTIYSGVPHILGWKANRNLVECSITELFGTNLQKYGLYMGVGFGLPLIGTDILYAILLFKLQKIFKRRQEYLEETDTDVSPASIYIWKKNVRSQRNAILNQTPKAHSAVKLIQNDSIRLEPFKDIPVGTRKHKTKRVLVYGGEGRDNQKRCIYLIGTILLLLNLSVTLPVGVHLIAIFETSVQLSKVLFQLMILIPMNNSLFNPWMYALQSQAFRQALKENFLC